MARAPITVEGLRPALRDLRKIDRDLQREALRGLKAATVREALPAVVAAAPKRTGRLARSLRVQATTRGVSIRSRVPYANPIHWGWPRHHIKPNPFIQRGAEARAERILDALAEEMDGFFARNGFR